MTFDISTEQGRQEVERVVMEAMGFQLYGRGRSAARWDRPGDLYKIVSWPVGYLFTPDGMVAAKKWAVEEMGLIIQSWTVEGGNGVYALKHRSFVPKQSRGRAPDEPHAVALALARALSERVA